MAWSVAINHKTVMGNMRMHVLSCVADDATQAVDTGLSKVFGFAIGAKSFTSGAPAVFHNVNASGVAANGYLGASGFTSGDEMLFVVFGV